MRQRKQMDAGWGWFIAVIFLLAMVALLGGCGGNVPLPNDCRLFGCPSGNECVLQDGGEYACQPIPPCSADNPCPEGKVCDDGTCVDAPPPPPPDNCPLDGEPAGEPDWPWCKDVGQKCSSEESPCKTNPSSDPYYCEEAVPCAPPPPEPQCSTFTDRGGTLQLQDAACDCYAGQVWVPCDGNPPPPPPDDECGFPQGIPNDKFTGFVNPGTYGSVVNKVMTDLTGCAVGSDCPITFHPDVWMGMVCEKLCEKGLNCGRHDNKPPGASDQISVKQGDFCDGLHENYKVYNYGGGKVIWAPNAKMDAWKIQCGTQPPPQGDCPQPHPNRNGMKFQLTKHQGKWDSTYTTVMQCAFCKEIGMGEMGGVVRCGCPIRPEGHPERLPCEKEFIGVQQWWCNGNKISSTSNPAQARCVGHVKTCTEDGRACSEADW